MSKYIINFTHTNTPLSYITNLKECKILPAPQANHRSGLDEVFHDYIITQVKEKTITELYIPISLTEDYLNFTGIHLGLHIRFTAELGGRQFIPIIFMADKLMTRDFICKNSSMGYFLYTKGVYLIEENEEVIKRELTKEHDSITINYIKDTLINKIIIEAPDFYDNRHSIDNEWGLIQLERTIGHKFLPITANTIKSDLYVKYLLMRINFVDVKSSEEKFYLRLSKKRKILLIDDEWSKGWLSFFEKILGHPDDDCLVDYIGFGKGDKKEDILEKFDNKNKNKYDLYILDIRLHENDFNLSTDYSEYLGYGILEKIYDDNKGSQVLIHSASNKQWIYDYAKNFSKGRMEVVTKPGLNTNMDDLENYPEYYADAIKNALSRDYLVKYATVNENILHQFKGVENDLPDDDDYLDVLTEVKYRLKKAFDCLVQFDIYKKEESEFIFIEYFLILECLNNLIIFQGNHRSDYYIDLNSSDREELILPRLEKAKGANRIVNSSRWYGTRENPSLSQKFFGIGRALGLNNRDLLGFISLNDMRNSIVHPNGNTTISKEECLKLLNIVYKYLSLYLKKVQT